MNDPFNILIPNYNGESLLEKYLPSIIEAALFCEVPFELVVMDDASTDHSVDLLKENFPRAAVFVNERNIGFGETVNLGMIHCKYPIVVLLNNDVRVEKDFFKPLLRHFTDNQTFAVAAKGLIVQEGVVMNESVSRLEFKNGFLNLIQPGIEQPDIAFDEVCTVAHACGGYAALDREKFVALGGFDPLYYPFYWEDVDLCYRAWKHGWRVLYEPASVAHHRCHATIDRNHRKEYVDMLHVRNRLLFTWKNLSKDLLIEHANALNRYLISAPDPFKKGFYEALKMADTVLEKRVGNSKEEKYSDKDVISKSSNRLVQAPSG